MKVQASIQGDAVRVSGAKRDDLQEAIALVRKSITDFPVQFGNFRDLTASLCRTCASVPLCRERLPFLQQAVVAARTHRLAPGSPAHVRACGRTARRPALRRLGGGPDDRR